ncbi:MAG: hypothetical protein JXN59_14825 [Anaerolineae bacterium]|nr:hypothetical protein [Anaerolineae bacterium]
MHEPTLSRDERRAYWWQAQRNDFGLPDFLYAPLPFAVLLVLALGAGSAFLGLYPGVNTHDVTLSGAGAPWIGLLVLVAFAALWYRAILHRGYSLPWMAGIVVLAIGLALAVNALALDVLLPDYPDALIGGLGMVALLGGLLLLMGFLFEGFVLCVLMGTLMGIFVGVLAGFALGFEYVLMMVAIYGPIGALLGSIGGLLRPWFAEFRRKQRLRRG